MSYKTETFLSKSEMIGNLTLVPLISSISSIQTELASTGSTDKPINLTPLLVNSGSNLAKAGNSVRQIGVLDSDEKTRLPSYHQCIHGN